MTLKTRLKKVETHPHTEYVQELARLKTQDAKPLFEVAYALMQAHPADATWHLIEMTDAQLIRLLLDSELTPEEREHYEQVLQTLPTLEAQADRNLSLLHSPPLSAEEAHQMAQECEEWLQGCGLRPMPNAGRKENVDANRAAFE